MSMHDASIPQKSPALKPTFPNHKICKNKTRVLPERLQKLKCTITPPLPPPHIQLLAHSIQQGRTRSTMKFVSWLGLLFVLNASTTVTAKDSAIKGEIKDVDLCGNGRLQL